MGRMITWEAADDLKWAKAFWKGPMELNAAIGNGNKSRFAKFLGKKMYGMKKLALKIKAGMKKTGLKIKAGVKKAGLKIKAGAKKVGLKLKVKKAAPKLKLKVKAKATPKLKVKAKACLKLKVKAKKHRRMQAVSTGVDLNNNKFAASVPQPTALAGDGQSSPAKSWMMFAGLMM